MVYPPLSLALPTLSASLELKKQPDIEKLPPPPKAELFETHFSCGICPNVPLLEKTVFLLSYSLFVLDSQPLRDGPCMGEERGGR